MMQDELRKKFETQAGWWRERAEQYRDNRIERRLKQCDEAAVETLMRLAATIADVPQPLLTAYNAAIERASPGDDLIDNEQMAFNYLGSGYKPNRATEFIEDFLEAHQRREGPLAMIFDES